MCHLPNEGIHDPNTYITTLINQCKFSHPETKEMFKIMVLYHVVRYHEAWDWIWLQDQSQLTYKALLSQCQLLESQCKQYQKTKEKGWANLTYLTAATSSASPINQDALSTFSKCSKCDYSHPQTNAWLKAKSAIIAAAGTTTLPCVDAIKDPSDPPVTSEPDYPDRTGRLPWRETRSRQSLPDNRYRSICSAGRHSSCSQSCSPSHSPSPHHNRNPRWHRRTTPFQYHQDSIEVNPAPSPTNSVETSKYLKEGSLLMESVYNGKAEFFTCLMFPTRNGMKSMTVKIDPGAEVNTIPLSRYCKIFPHKIDESRYPKQSTLIPTNHSLISHNGKPQPFLGHFIVDVNTATQSRSYLTQFFV